MDPTILNIFRQILLTLTKCQIWPFYIRCLMDILVKFDIFAFLVTVKLANEYSGVLCQLARVAVYAG